MWLAILASLLVLVLAPVLRVLYTFYRAKRNLKFYEKQGLKTFYFPIFSILGLEDRKMPGNESGSNNEFLLKTCNENMHLPGLAVNSLGCSSSYVLLYKPEFIREYLLIEDNLLKMPLDKTFAEQSGFFYYNGERAVAARALFNKIFGYESVSTYAPEICRVINSQFEKTIHELQINEHSFTKINLNPVIEPIFEQILYLLVFGHPKMPKTATGRSIYQLVYDFFRLFPEIRKNLLYLLMPTIALKYELTEGIRKAKKITQVLQSHLKMIYEQREKEGATSECMLDKIILNNRECHQTKQMQGFVDEKELAGMINIIVFAGTDTSENQSKISLCKMADRKDLQDLFDEINPNLYDSQGLTTAEKLDSDESLSLWIKEANRIWSPIGRTTPRYVTKDLKINGLNIRKGDRLSVYVGGLHMTESVFPDAKTFKLDRFSKENEKKIPRFQHIPFFFGKRVCPGRHLGELMVKLVVSQFCRHFEFRKPAGLEYYVHNVLLNRVELPEVEVRLKKSSGLATK